MLEITTKKNSKDEARKLYNDLIKPDVDALNQKKGKGKNKRNNILNFLNNIGSSFFEDHYLNYSGNKPKSDTE